MKLVINGDDFGYTKSNSEGIIKGYQDGILRSTSALSNGKYLEYAYELWKENMSISLYLLCFRIK